MTSSPKIASLFSALSIVFLGGCGLVIGLERDYPPDGRSDIIIEAESLTEPDIEEESNCIIEEPVQVTGLGIDEQTSREPALDYIDTGEEAFWGMAWRYGQDNDGNIRYAKVSLEGEIISVPTVLTDNNTSFFPDIASADDGFGIVWQEKRETGGSPDYDVIFNYLTPEGVMAATHNVIESPELATQPSIAWNGESSEFAVVWRDSRDGSNEIWFLRFGKDVSEIGLETKITDMDGGSSNPRIAWSGSEYAVAWLNNSTGHDSVYFTRLGPDGSRMFADILIYESNRAARTPSVVKDFLGYAMSWSDNSTENREIYFTRLDWLGNKLLENIRLTHYPSNSSDPHLRYNTSTEHGNLYHICWTDNRYENDEVFVVTVNDSGTALSYEGRVTERVGLSVSCFVASSPHRDGIFWVDSVGSLNLDIFFSEFSCVN